MIEVKITGADGVIQHLDAIGPRVRVELRKAVDLQAMKVLARTKLKLSDDVLHVRTGRLRRSITQTVTDDATGIYGTVGTNVEYARFQELGFTGAQNIRAHVRNVKAAFGKSLKGGAVTVAVKGHSRHVEYPAHSFLASAVRELEDDFKFPERRYGAGTSRIAPYRPNIGPAVEPIVSACWPSGLRARPAAAWLVDAGLLSFKLQSRQDA